MRVPYYEMQQQFLHVLVKYGLSTDRAELCAALFAEASLDGIPSHGLNRFPLFLEFIRKGYIHVDAEPRLTASFGASERWDGGSGPGNLNAHASMKRAIELAKLHGMGCVALSNTNHWMRGGSYGWQAAEAGCIGICWTNTNPNLPAWGSTEAKVGNNPIVLAVPRPEGHLVLDMAMSQFSYGQLTNYSLLGKQLPVDGGFDNEGNATRDPGAILQSQRPLPIGFWKGSGLSLMLDMIGMVLSGGKSTRDIGKLGVELQVSQVFLAFDTQIFSDYNELTQRINETIRDIHSANPVSPQDDIRYPGEDTLRRRLENLRHGIPVDAAIWQQVLES
ncbi:MULTISPECIES: 3-dehydro-L-gulonate 2-dehydrogenase [unclassified Paenibacillus]|uniref:3-dehydro-L-gulonate 2-dehydrogenase n=1 Tax=unclassified Paenibacillus TaxID=185978 RepID=UPI00362D7ABE